MEIKLPLGGPPPASLRETASALPLTLLKSAGGIEFVKSAQSARHIDEILTTATERYVSEQDRETQRDVVQRTAEIVSTLDRNLKFEVHEDAGIVQIQVIDTTDGRVVRKIPADEVLKLVSQIRETMSERLDVRV
jgi:uncharacterized FlaG/YvyC family protein